MAQPELDYFRKRGIALKAEVTEGTDSVPTAVANGIRLFEGSSGTEFDTVERKIDRAHFTNHPFGVANKRAFIEGGMELYPPATPGAVATSSIDGEIALLIAGMAVTKNLGAKTTTYNPISAAIPSASAYWWHVDYHKQVLGCRANLTGVKMAIGERFMAQLRLQGTYTNVTEDAIPAITLPTTIPVIAQFDNSETNINIDGGGDLLVWAKELSLDFGNTLTSKEYTSKKVHAPTDRMATWSLRIARTDLSDFNPWTVRDAGTLFEARMRTYVADPGLYSEIGIRGQIEQITETDIDGDLGLELTGRCIASDAGGDEFYLLFGDTTP